MIKVIKDINEVLDFSVELSKDNNRASYPRLFNEEVVRIELEKRIKSNTSRVLAYYKEEKLCGVCAYYFISEELYAQTTFFLISEDYEVVADSFIEYMKQDIANYEMLIGVPSTNIESINYFNKIKAPIGENSIVAEIYNLQSNEDNLNSSISIIEKENFDEYANFHDKFAIAMEMFYDSKNLYKDINRFLTLAYKIDEKIVASIFGCDVEIFGCFVEEEYKGTEIRSILLKSFLNEICKKFGEIKEYIYFIEKGQDEELSVALETGFKIREEYVMYVCQF